MADDEDISHAQQDDDAWIEHVVGIAGHLGCNKMRLRWKLIRWQQQRRRTARRREQLVAHITYAHKTCPECGAVQDRDEAICTRCSAKLGKRGFQVLERIGLAVPVPISMSTLLVVALLAAYGRMWIAGGGGLASPHGALLIEFGGRWPPLIAAEPWRLVTAMFLHAGLWHLAFNILAIATVGPRIEELYGRATMLAVFLATGAIANLAALPVGALGVGVGASGGVMGLIGAAAGAGHRARTSQGHALRDAMIKWSAYTFLFGFAVGADNWAHLFGAITGAAFGLAVKPEVWMRRSLIVVRVGVGLAGVIATVGAVALICARSPSLPEAEAAPAPTRADLATAQRAMLDDHAEMCTRLYAGDTQGAIAAAARTLPALGDRTQGEHLASVIATMCEDLQRLRDDCKTKGATPARESNDLCELYAPLFGRLPVHPYQRRPEAPANNIGDRARAP